MCIWLNVAKFQKLNTFAQRKPLTSYLCAFARKYKPSEVMRINLENSWFGKFFVNFLLNSLTFEIYIPTILLITSVPNGEL